MSQDDDKFAARIAAHVLDGLNASVIPSQFPAEVGDYIRQATRHGNYVTDHLIPLTGPNALYARWMLQVDGSMTLLLTLDNNIFWRGTFRPV